MSKKKPIETQGESVQEDQEGSQESESPPEESAKSASLTECADTARPEAEKTLPSSVAPNDLPSLASEQEAALVAEASLKLAVYALEKAKSVPAVEALPAVWQAIEAVPANRQLLMLALQRAMPKAWQTQPVMHWLESSSDASLRAVLSMNAAFWALGHNQALSKQAK